MIFYKFKYLSFLPMKNNRPVSVKEVTKRDPGNRKFIKKKKRKERKRQLEARSELQNMNTPEWKVNETSCGDRSSFVHASNRIESNIMRICNQTFLQRPPILKYEPSSPPELEDTPEQDYGSFIQEWSP